MATENSNNAPLGFLSLPTELRIKVYNNLMVPEEDRDIDIESSAEYSNIIHIRKNPPKIYGKPRTGQLLATHSIIRNEALSILYGRHVFRAYNTEDLNYGIGQIGIGSSYIQSVILRDPTCDFDHGRCGYQPSLLDLPNLKQVTLWCEHKFRPGRDKKTPPEFILDTFRHSRPIRTHALRVFMEQVTGLPDVTWRLHMRWKAVGFYEKTIECLLIEFGIEDDESQPRNKPKWKWEVIEQKR